MAASGAFTRWRGGWAALAITAVARNLVSTVVALLLVTLVPAAFGWHPTVVMTPSMEPRIHVGDVIVAQPADPDRLRIGQVLLVDDPDWPGRLRLHRFVRVTKGSRLVLRGDANDHADTSTVALSAVHGIASLRVPVLGLPTVWLRTGQLGPLGLAAGGLGLLLAATFLFRTDEQAAPTGPPDPRWRRRGRGLARRARRALRGRRPAAALGAAGAFLLVVVAATPALAAPMVATTGNPSSSWATANRFGCGDRILGDSPMDYWKLNETTFTTATDQKGARNGTYSGGVSTTNGPCLGDGDTAVTLSGSASVGITTSTFFSPSSLANFSEEIWFKAGSGASGLLIGAWTDPTNPSASNDRVLMMSSNGKIVFGMFDTSIGNGAIAASPSTYQDSTWHLATATYSSSAGMTLYIDGASVATHAAVSQYTAQNEYWRIGFGDVSYAGWKPSGGGTPATAFAGSVAEAATYTSTLAATQAANHYGARTLSCSSSLGADSPYLYWKLAETGVGFTAADASGNGHSGSYPVTGVTKGVAGPCGLEGTTGVTLDGGSTTGITPSSSSDSITAPTAFTEEAWFRTSSSGGGLLIGLYNAQTSGAGDRIVYMDTTGRIAFGMYNGSQYVVTSPSTCNDGSWHHVAATWSSATGMRLYLDGVQVGTSTGPGSNNSFTGFWRVGYGSLNGWPNAPTAGFAGSVAGAAVYLSALSGPRIAAHAAAR